MINHLRLHIADVYNEVFGYIKHFKTYISGWRLTVTFLVLTWRKNIAGKISFERFGICGIQPF